MKSGRLFADTRAKIKQAVKELRNEPIIGSDTETSSLDPHTLKLWSIQFGTPDFQCLIPINNKSFYIGEFEDILADEEIEIIMHRATFDLKVMWANGWRTIRNIHCTRTAEQLITAGTFANTSLAGTLKRYFGIDMSKDERGDFYKAEDGKEADERGMITMFEASGCKWTPELQNYALSDVEHLVPLREAQMKRLAAEGMERLWEKIEKPLVETTALLEFRGVRMDEKECKDFQARMKKRADEAEVELVKVLDVKWKAYALPLFEKNFATYQKWSTKHQKIVKETNGDRDPLNKKKISQEAMQKRKIHEEVKPFRTVPKPPKDINLNSVPQMRHALEQMDIYLPNMQKMTLEDAAGEHPILTDLAEYKKYEKLGQMSEIWEKINRATGRIHQELNQNVDTGRFSSKNPNLTNIPARADEGKMFRALFTASLGSLLGVADYAAIELIIIGIKSGDKKLLHALNNNLDMHCWTMSHFLNCDYESLVRLKDNKEKMEARGSDYKIVADARKKFEKAFSLPDLKKLKGEYADLEKWVKTFRDYCKTLTYGIAYGLSSFGLSRKFHCEPDDAQRFIDVFFSIYPSIKRWLDSQSDFAERTGYSKTGSGRRRYYIRPRKPGNADVQTEMTRILKQQDRDPESLSDQEWNEIWEDIEKKLYRQYRQTLGRIRRQAANQPIQGLSADITKRAMVLFEDWWKVYCEEHAIDRFKFGIVLTVHDELVIDVPKKHIKTAITQLKWAMEYSAKSLLGDNANIVVSPIITPFWKK